MNFSVSIPFGIISKFLKKRFLPASLLHASLSDAKIFIPILHIKLYVFLIMDFVCQFECEWTILVGTWVNSAAIKGNKLL